MLLQELRLAALAHVILVLGRRTGTHPLAFEFRGVIELLSEGRIEELGRGIAVNKAVVLGLLCRIHGLAHDVRALLGNHAQGHKLRRSEGVPNDRFAGPVDLLPRGVLIPYPIHPGEAGVQVLRGKVGYAVVNARKKLFRSGERLGYGLLRALVGPDGHVLQRANFVRIEALTKLLAKREVVVVQTDNVVHQKLRIGHPLLGALGLAGGLVGLRAVRSDRAALGVVVLATNAHDKAPRTAFLGLYSMEGLGSITKARCF